MFGKHQQVVWRVELKRMWLQVSVCILSATQKSVRTGAQFGSGTTSGG